MNEQTDDYRDRMIAELRKQRDAHGRAISRLVEERDALREELARAIVARNRARDSRDHTRYFYGQRMDRLRAYAKEHGFWPDVACIFANGKLMSDPSMTPGAMRRFRLEVALRGVTAERDRAVADLALARDAIGAAVEGVAHLAHPRPLGDDRECGLPWYEMAARVLLELRRRADLPPPR